MTTIIGLQGKGWTVLGADSKISSFDDNGFISGQTILPKTSSKLAEKDEYILGAAGDVRAINLLHHVFQPPSTRYATTPEKLDQHITRRFVPVLRNCFDDEGFSPPDKQERDHQAEQNSTIIVSVRANIYIIESDYSWSKDATGIYAIGTGYQYARAALHILIDNSTEGLTMKRAIEVTTTALQVAGTHDPYTGGPCHIYTQREGK